MTAEIITIGDEILIGQIIDSNSAYISKELNKIGISVYQITSIQDERQHILTALKEAAERVDVILVTGGLGPTKDDITKKCLLEFFDDQLVRNEQVLRHIENLFEKYIETPISDLNRDQALVPSQATVLHNEYGTAPGMWFEKDRKVFISMPGVPYEMKALMAREIIPRLTETFSRPVILHKTVMTYGLGESAIAEKIEDWENGLPEFIKLAYLPNLGRVRLRLSAKGKDREVLEKAIEQEVQKLHGIIGDIIYGYEEENALEETIGRVLKENRWTLATAESCSGGRLASLFTEHPGASEYFMGSLVCYATRSKVEILGVEQELVDQFSVVSGEVAEAMAQKAREKMHADFAISTTGNAGPSKGDSDADVGTVFIGIATPSGTYSEKFNFGNHREKVVGKTVNKSMELILKAILHEKESQ
ncbi:competence/damage-inducible protein A [Christiangramia flava]|uniref:CinA-like protein n=1 Tax=Christiangramia flava JLT2011 TaxID=1229726 RepID=A0A1L7I6P9_9FLAO|nr:competence/damage-inducible protein A [Christiangramia flava]APU69289.1 Molybdopterin binding motif, CinA N-terminal domain [Christiangramia flava JLT2011]OSS38812.1 Molybdopterin binding motif, CinA N-terminal domain / C-terminal domain of CinA type S [Christiangramia flava JLT2011]